MHGLFLARRKKNVISETGTVMLINLCSNPVSTQNISVINSHQKREPTQERTKYNLT